MLELLEIVIPSSIQDPLEMPPASYFYSIHKDYVIIGRIRYAVLYYERVAPDQIRCRRRLTIN
jgi:hypothetical protein